MASKCRANDISTCRVHGTGSMYERLQNEATEAINKRDFNTYREVRWEMDELTDDSKAALKFFERGGVPTIAQRVGNKMNAFADSIIETRDNINDAVLATLDGSNKSEREKTATPTPEGETPKLSMVEKVEDFADRMADMGEAISEGAGQIADRHVAPIPTDVGGSTLAWSDLNPFKNGKLR